jgi:DNA primase
MPQSIEDVLRELAPQSLAGAVLSTNYVMVRCPFHGGGLERTPSCSVSRVKPVFFCHGCSVAGHISKFLRQVGAPTDIAKSVVEKISYDYSEYGDGKSAHSIFTGANPFRGKFVLDDEILDGWRLRPETLYRAGFKERTLRHFEVGVDHTMARVTFPLRNLYGELVGVSGRTMVQGLEPRYKIYSEKDLARFGVSPKYSMASIKGALLWHAHLIFPICFRDRSPIIVCEGFKAAMWIWQMGYHNVVALIGAHLTKLQAELLARTASEVTLFLDNNEAGHKGTHAAGKLLVSKNIVKVAKYPDLRQQADQLQEAEIQSSISSASYYVQWKSENREKRTS